MFAKITTLNHFFLYYKGELIYKAFLTTNEASVIMGKTSQGGAFKLPKD